MIEVLKSLGFQPNNEDLYLRAITHRSYAYEHPSETTGHNERLEFLGDGILNLVIGKALYDRWPQAPEGILSKMRSSLVNETKLSEIAAENGFSELIRLGKGEAKSGGNLKPSVLAGVLEAFLGATYLDLGFSATEQLILKWFKDSLDGFELQGFEEKDYKSRLQELSQSALKVTPFYRLLKEDGPDHSKLFWMEVKLGEKLTFVGEGKSKKLAEQEAAKLAISQFVEDIK